MTVLFAGIDVGSRAVKIVILNQQKEIVATGVCDQGIHQNEIATNLLNQVLEQHKYTIKDIQKCVATGYARSLIQFADQTVTEITCHAKGCAFLLPGVRTILEIGGQDSKAISLNENGKVQDFMMNDRCAAGTGRFLEMVAVRLNLEIANFKDLLQDHNAMLSPANISSMCVVFAESEIIGLLASEVSPAKILVGVENALASRVLSMVGKQNLNEKIVFTGGVALIPGMKEALEKVTNKPISIMKNPQMTGALGAALIASGA